MNSYAQAHSQNKTFFSNYFKAKKAFFGAVEGIQDYFPFIGVFNIFLKILHFHRPHKETSPALKISTLKNCFKKEGIYEAVSLPSTVLCCFPRQET